MWFPASLVKLMTAYATFDAVKKGKITWATKVPLSDHARGQPATRIGLRVGIEVTVDQAVRGMILRSANDFSMALAELIGGSEIGFADVMNAHAKRLGMTRSHFKNPHGLPDPEQVTTARDMASLTMALIKDFPEQADVFSGDTVRIHKGTFVSQNNLLRTLLGADGMKTGFTCGAGYNLVASATRDGHRVVAVILGATTKTARSERAAALIEQGFAHHVGTERLASQRLADLPFDPLHAMPPPDMSRQARLATCGRGPGGPPAFIAKSSGGSTAPLQRSGVKLVPATTGSVQKPAKIKKDDAWRPARTEP